MTSPTGTLNNLGVRLAGCAPGLEYGVTMIVCSCQRITDRDIHAAIDWMRASDPMTLITPGKVYRALGKAPDCGGCVRLFVAEMRRNALLKVPDLPAELRNLRASVDV